MSVNWIAINGVKVWVEGTPQEIARRSADELTDQERADLFAHYCRDCGSKNPNCQCWNDE